MRCQAHATNGTRAAHMAISPNAIPAAVMYGPILLTLVFDGGRMTAERWSCCELVHTRPDFAGRWGLRFKPPG